VPFENIVSTLALCSRSLLSSHSGLEPSVGSLPSLLLDSLLSLLSSTYGLRVICKALFRFSVTAEAFTVFASVIVRYFKKELFYDTFGVVIHCVGNGIPKLFVSQYDVELDLDPDFHRPYLPNAPTLARPVATHNEGSLSPLPVLDVRPASSPKPENNVQRAPNENYTQSPHSGGATDIFFNPSAYESSSTSSTLATFDCGQCNKIFTRYCDLK
jgi:hypothetical protein